MSARYYTRAGEPVEGDDVIAWARAFEDGDRVVKQENVGDYWVSTVFLGLNHQYGDGPPLIFETMVFKGSYSDLYCDRYSTEEQAREGHARVVAGLQDGTLELYGEDS